MHGNHAFLGVFHQNLLLLLSMKSWGTACPPGFDRVNFFWSGWANAKESCNLEIIVHVAKSNN